MAGKRDFKKKRLQNFLKKKTTSESGSKSVLNDKKIIDSNVKVNDDVKKTKTKEIRRFIKSIHSSGCFLYTNPYGIF